jgi:hypothetical protein
LLLIELKCEYQKKGVCVDKSEEEYSVSLDPNEIDCSKVCE